MLSTAYNLLPVNAKDRVVLLDILRGFAIFGIFIMNLESYTFYWMLNESQKGAVYLAAYDDVTGFLQSVFFEGKFYSIFSLLFGIGFAIYLSKTDKQKDILGIFKRRLFILLIIGILHLFIWPGDIVAFYAMLGFVLIPFRKFTNKTLLIIAACCIISPIGWYALKMAYPVLDVSKWFYKNGEQYAGTLGITSPQALYKVLSGNDAFEMFRVNLAGIFFRYGDLIFQSRGFKVFGMFLIGLVVGRAEIYNALQANRKLLKKILIVGLVIGLPANYYLAVLDGQDGYYNLTFHGLKQTTAYAFGVVPLALAYVSMITLFYLTVSGKKLLYFFAPVGKMALTNYILQTIIGIITFSSLGFGVRPMGPTAWTLFALAIFVLQVMISTVWLRFFNYGPLEWIWKSATYKKWQPILKS